MSARNAVVRIQNVQYRVAENDVIEVPRMEAEVGSTVELADVLMLGGDEPQVGTPLIDGASVAAEVVEHGRAAKVIVFKMKRRKGYRRRAGHRQQFTTLRITAIQG